MAASAASPRVGRGRQGCLLRLFVAVAAFTGIVLLVDEVWPRVGPSPHQSPGAAIPEPQAALPTVTDLPDGFRADTVATGLIVNSRKAAGSPDAEAALDRLLRWGRLTGYRAAFTSPAAGGAPAARFVADASVFRDAAGADAYFQREQTVRPAGATPFEASAGQAAAGWLAPGNGPRYAAVRLIFVEGRQVIELSLTGPDSLANPAEAERLARLIAGRIGQ